MNEAEFTATSRITLGHKPGMTTSKMIKCDFFLDISPNLDKTMYLLPNGLPAKEGIKPLTQALIQGLVGNIHYAHKAGFRNEVEHLNYIIAELGRSFAHIKESSEGKF